MRMVPSELASSRLPANRLIMASDIDSLSHHWELHGERRAGSRRAVHADLAGMLLNDSVGHRKPQSGPAAVARLAALFLVVKNGS